MWRSGYGKWTYCEKTWTDEWEVLQDGIGSELAHLFSQESPPDGFRQVIVELVETPPQEWLTERIGELRKSAAWRLKLADELETHLE
jgi:hypothetical protein